MHTHHFFSEQNEPPHSHHVRVRFIYKIRGNTPETNHHNSLTLRHYSTTTLFWRCRHSTKGYNPNGHARCLGGQSIAPRQKQRAAPPQNKRPTALHLFQATRVPRPQRAPNHSRSRVPSIKPAHEPRFPSRGVRLWSSQFTLDDTRL